MATEPEKTATSIQSNRDRWGANKAGGRGGGEVAHEAPLTVRMAEGDAAAKKYMNRIARLHPDKLVRVREGDAGKGRRVRVGRDKARGWADVGACGFRERGFHKTYVAL